METNLIIDEEMFCTTTSNREQNNQKQPEEESKLMNTLASGYSIQSLKFLTQHVLFPSCKLLKFSPPVEFATSGVIIETACLSHLYKVFERC